MLWFRYRTRQNVRAHYSEQIAELELDRQDNGERLFGSLRRHLAALKGVVFQAWNEGLMTSDTLQRSKAIKSRRSYRLPKGRCLTMEESSRLLSCHRGQHPVVDERDRAVLTLMLGCGLRRDEVC